MYDSLSNLKADGSVVEDVLAKEVEKISVVLYGKMGWRAHSCLPIWPPYKLCRSCKVSVAIASDIKFQ